MISHIRRHYAQNGQVNFSIALSEATPTSPEEYVELSGFLNPNTGEYRGYISIYDDSESETTFALDKIDDLVQALLELKVSLPNPKKEPA